MPELPEVETQLKAIAGWIGTEKISSVVVRNKRLRKTIAEDFAPRLTAVCCLQFQRRGKVMVITLDTGDRWLTHLGMTGKYVVHADGAELSPHDHMVLNLASGLTISYRDVRKFGQLLILAPEQPCAMLDNLGLEPFDQNLTPQWLLKICQSRQLAIKQFLLDGTKIAGIGNIYASEVLFQAGILPSRRASSLKLVEIERLLAAIRQVLTAAIAAGGSTIKDFATPTGETGYFQHQFAVYGKNGQACQRCAMLIEKQTLAQRSTFYCPQCQT